MKRKLLITFIICGFILACVFPVLGIISLFGKVEVSKDTNDLIRLEETKKETVSKLEPGSSNKKVNVDALELNEVEVDDEDLPLSNGIAGADKVVVTGAVLKENYLSHKDDIDNKIITFEIITKDGDNLFFKTYEELEFFVKDDEYFEKSFVLDEESKLKRYTYLQITKEDAKEIEEEKKSLEKNDIDDTKDKDSKSNKKNK